MTRTLIIAVLLGACSPKDKSSAAPAHGDSAPPDHAAKAAAGPIDAPPPAPPDQGTPTTMMPKLDATLEAELEAIRQDPSQAVGSGEKSYVPYQPNRADGLIKSRDPVVTERLLAEARGGGDRVFRLAVLHVLGKRTDDGVDPALISALDDPELRATAAYLLGRPNFKGYAKRERDVAKVRDALRAHLQDPTVFDDPFRRKTFHTQDFVLAAYVRMTGPEKFRIADKILAEMIGYTVPSFDDAVRADLLDQARTVD